MRTSLYSIAVRLTFYFAANNIQTCRTSAGKAIHGAARGVGGAQCRRPAWRLGGRDGIAFMVGRLMGDNARLVGCRVGCWNGALVGDRVGRVVGSDLVGGADGGYTNVCLTSMLNLALLTLLVARIGGGCWSIRVFLGASSGRTAPLLTVKCTGGSLSGACTVCALFRSASAGYVA
jgi:hypothetical protein